MVSEDGIRSVRARLSGERLGVYQFDEGDRTQLIALASQIQLLLS